MDDFPIVETFSLTATGDNQNSSVSVDVDADLALSESNDSLTGNVRLNVTGMTVRTRTMGEFAITVGFVVRDGLFKIDLDGPLQTSRSEPFSVSAESSVRLSSLTRAQDGSIANIESLVLVRPPRLDDDAVSASATADVSETLSPGEYRLQFLVTATVSSTRTGTSMLDLDVSVEPADADLFFWEANDGVFDEPTNWEPEDAPESGDTTVFDRDPQYTVTFGTERVERARVERGAPTFSGGSFTLESLELERGRRSLEVGTSAADTIAALSLQNHTLNAVHAVVGRDANALGALAAGAGAVLNASGRLSIGFEGTGEFGLNSGATATTGETRIGERPGGNGTARIEGPGTTWMTGSLAAGMSGQADVVVLGGAQVMSDVVDIGSGGIDPKDVDGSASATVSGEGSRWTSSGIFTVGARAPANVEIAQSAAVNVSPEMTVGLFECGSVLLNGAGTGEPATTLATPGLSIGGGSIGFLELIGNSTIDAGFVNLGVDTESTGEIEVDGAILGADRIEIGGIALNNEVPGKGLLTFESEGTALVTGTITVNNGGTIQGDGLVSAEMLIAAPDSKLTPGLVNETIEIPCLPEAPPALAQKQAAPRTFGTLVIDGDAEVAGTLELVAAGNADAQFGQLEIKGDAVFTNPVFRVLFVDGYAPKQGDTISFIDVDGTLDISNPSTAVEGVEPGFEFSITSENGAVVLEALNDAVSSNPQTPSGIFSDSFESGSGRRMRTHRAL